MISSHPSSGYWPPSPVILAILTRSGAVIQAEPAGRESSKMRIPLIILGLLAVLWPFSYYQLIVNFWPYLLQSMTTGEKTFWYDLLYPVYTYIYLLGPFVFAAVLIYIIVMIVWRRTHVPNGT
jgi:hypothetical protein